MHNLPVSEVQKKLNTARVQLTRSKQRVETLSTAAALSRAEAKELSKILSKVQKLLKKVLKDSGDMINQSKRTSKVAISMRHVFETAINTVLEDIKKGLQGKRL